MFLAAFDIILSLVAFLGNTLILDALRKESSIRPPFGPQKVEKKFKKSEKGTKAFAFEIRCSISPYTKKDFHLSLQQSLTDLGNNPVAFYPLRETSSI
ncbi:hypothetical protein pdam_00019713 [Pocillopora damicornis]|uniref:Uncharacterized protein n=1 Tax=Pocillopora damicornis TaxID=46731 RepID=A0A3M6TYZ3_POCDA|nr:hypothetical protein pdam_00019713 [Pocillopora damicornis]